ncbi:MAG: ABC transporter ATP-binding protein [Chloroflexi bacterium]|nr:ABC transporter ATP-binding protein [Chloroflexota bacterium]
MVKVKNLFKTFGTDRGDVKAVQDISFEVEKGGFFTLLGPSGCGKSTTLRCIAGLEKPESGEIIIGDKIMFSSEKRINVPPNKREMGMVFQSYAIWPHMTVFENAAFPLHVNRRGLTAAQVRDSVMKALDLVRLQGLEDRPAPQLSGGQQQRLALARALVREPQVMLLDEPLSNLDAKLREAMRLELRELMRRLNITALYVTHDQIEALAMSRTVAVMSEGRLVQLASPRDIYAKPSCRFVADFIGSSNFFEGNVVEAAPPGGQGKVKTKHGVFVSYLPQDAKVNDKVVLCFRPENIEVEHQKPADNINIIPGKIEVGAFLGEFVDATISVDGDLVRARLHPTVPIHRGDDVFLRLPPETCISVFCD